MAHRLRIVALLALVLTAACGSDGGSGPVGDATVPVDTQGGVDTGATSTSDVTTATDTETPVPRCTSDGDCTGDEICACTGECVVPTGKACTEDRNCGIPNWCNPCTKHCEVQSLLCEPCTNARGCQDDGACLPYAAGGTFCGRSCVADPGCPKGYACLPVGGVDQKQCVARSGLCEALGLCQTDGDCADELICNVGTGACYAGCTDDLSCPQNNVCQRGHCVPPCGDNGDCTAPEECTVDGKCKVPGACERKADCPTPETYCDKDAGVCKDGCLGDNDCGDAAKECKAGSCVPRGCQHNFECQFSHECNKTTGQCVPSTDPHCGACGDSGTTACDDPRLCASFKDQDDVDRGEFCLLPCANDPIDQCPSGYQCQQVEIDGQPKFFCARQCYVDPVNPTP